MKTIIRLINYFGYQCPVCEDVRHQLKGHSCSKLDGENGLAAATMRAWEQEWGNGASGDAGAMLRQELRSVIRRYGQESDITAYQAIGALRVVEHDIVDMLDSTNNPS
jgi:hypothetical protein